MKNIGKKYGLLTIVDRKRENKRTYYYCKCECGNEKWIRADTVNSGRQKSCGCLQKQTQFKYKDLTGMRFSRLIVVSKTDKRDSNGCIIWNCKCDCGNFKEVSEPLLSSNSVMSCGCLQKETMSLNGKKVGELHVKNNIIDGTNIQVIDRKTPLSNNTSGITGVSWDASRKKWIAQIWFKNKHYNLGRFDKKKDAIKARKKAEEKLHNEFLEFNKERIKHGK